MSDNTPAEPTSFAQREVAIAGVIGLWLVTNGTGVVLRILTAAHIAVPPAQLALFTNYLTPIVSGIVLGLFGLILRRYVAPAWKLVQKELTGIGVTVPPASGWTAADLAQINVAPAEPVPVPTAAAHSTPSVTGSGTATDPLVVSGATVDGTVTPAAT